MPAELKASRRDTTLILTLSNPGAKNALHPDMYAAAIEALSTAERDSTIRAVILTGADNCFCSGGNVRRLQEARAQDPSVQAESIDQLHGWIDAMRGCPKPIIAAVDGTAAGSGFSLALACDLIVAGTSATFRMDQVKVGISPEGGGSWFVARALPWQLASQILLEGKAISAERLHQLGVVNKTVADGTALFSAMGWADELAKRSPNAIENIKALIVDAQTNTLNQHFKAEKQGFLQTLYHADAFEGINAALENRKPRFKY